MSTFKNSRKSLDEYLSWRKSRSIPALNSIKKYFGSFKNKRILEIGCGYGPLTSLLIDEEALVTAVEVDEHKLDIAKKKFGKYKNVKFALVKDEILDLPSKSFDIIILFDVIEHIDRPEVTIKECQRLLNKNGVLYVEFTPYYSPTGHHLYDFAKWPIHILPKEKIKNIVYTKKITSFMTPDDYWATYTSLNKLRISDFQRMINNLRVLDEKYIVKYPDSFEINLAFLKYFGRFKDYFTMSFEGIYKKID